MENQLEVPLDPDQVRRLQENDVYCRKQISRLQKTQKHLDNFYMDNGILKRTLVENQFEYQTTVLPRRLIPSVFQTAHNYAGHNGFPRTYATLRRLFYWKGYKKEILDLCKNCARCQLHNIAVVNFEHKSFSPGRCPMDFIAMDLIGEFHPPTSEGHRYALTATCMLTGYMFCVPLKTKTAAEVHKAYLHHIYCKFGGSRKILTDNGTEFKNKLFKESAQRLGVDFSLTSPVYRPQSNGRIESFHRFLKTCIGKHITPDHEWDEVVPLAIAAYNFYPIKSSKESGFFSMFGRDPWTPLQQILQPTVRYLGEDGIPDLDALDRMYQVIAENIRRARDKRVDKLNRGFKANPKHLSIKPGDSVFVKDHTAKPFEPKYKDKLRVIKRQGDNFLIVRSLDGQTTKYHVSDVKKAQSIDFIANTIPDYQHFGRLARLDLPPENIPDLGWDDEDLDEQEPEPEDFHLDLLYGQLDDMGTLIEMIDVWTAPCKATSTPMIITTILQPAPEQLQRRPFPVATATADCRAVVPYCPTPTLRVATH